MAGPMVRASVNAFIAPSRLLSEAAGRSTHHIALAPPHHQACKRTMDCKCPECAAAAAAFSVDDLRAIKSNISYGKFCLGVAVLLRFLRLRGSWGWADRSLHRPPNQTTADDSDDESGSPKRNNNSAWEPLAWPPSYSKLLRRA